MSTISKSRNPLNHKGTSQVERYLQALSPDYFKINDQSIKNLFNAAFEYAGLVNFYNKENQIQGDWTCFWKVEMLTFLASISSIDPDSLLQNYFKIKEDSKLLLENNDGDDFIREQNNYHVQLIEFLRSQALRIEEAIHFLPDDLPLKQEIIALVQKDALTDTEQLSSDLKSLIGFHKEAYYRVYEENLESDHYEEFIDNHWGIDNADVYYNDINHSDSYRFNDQEELDKIAKAFYKTFKKIKTRAAYWFDLNLDTPQLHEPHVALFLTFLRLFNHARNSLNSLTKKHLEFFYEQVLCVRKRNAMPDDVHLIMELASTVDSHLVEKGVSFLAGQDINGKPLIFKTLEDWFLNKTQVKEIKTTYIDVHGILQDSQANRPKKITATSDVRTAFKQGEERPNETNESWRASGDNIDLPNGEIGFAIASPQLILREGKRVVDIKISFADIDSIKNFSAIDIPDEYIDFFDLELSTKNEWSNLERNTQIDFSEGDIELEIVEASFNSRFILGDDVPALDIRIILERDHPSIESFEEDVPGVSSEWPTVKFLINTNSTTRAAELYEALRSVKITEIKIAVDVKGVKENLIVQNDLGVFNGTQKFYPFGPVPAVGDQFYIGSTEVFQKELDSLTFNFSWIDPPDEYKEHYDEYFLNGDRLFYLPQLRIDYLEKAELPERAKKKFPPTYVGERNEGAGPIKVEGIVVDVSGGILPGVNIVISGTTTGTTTDFDGKFSISVSNPNSAMLEASFVGFTTLDIPVLGYSNVNIVLIDESDPDPDINARYLNLIADNKFVDNFNLTQVPLIRDTRVQEFLQYSPTLKRGFVRFALSSNDFLHKEYQNALMLKTIDISNPPPILISAAIETPNKKLPNQPYTPATNGISLNYTSTQIITGEDNEGIDKFYHLYPFNGYAEVPLIPQEKDLETETCIPIPATEDEQLVIPLVPLFEKPSIETQSSSQLANANLYIGLEGLKPGNVISLLFQVQEGSEPYPEIDAPEVDWAYLSKDNLWQPISRKNILEDSTNGLGRTGIIKIATPTTMTNETTLFNGTCYWLRAFLEEEKIEGQIISSVRGMSNIIDVKAQAILAEFSNQENDLSHLEQPLPSGKIKQLQVSQSAVKKIEQPFNSFNGRLPEEGNMFYVRVSERLRHRDRAITIYDYERLILDSFSKIQRAKCLNHTKPGIPNILNDSMVADEEVVPGHVSVVVIPIRTNLSGSAAAEPRFSKGDLKEMEDYLRTRTNLFVAHYDDKNNESYLRVINPLYEEVQLCFKVQFHINEDKEARRFDLDNAIKSYLAPWLLDQDKEIVFNRTLNRSQIILFLENLSYVDAISELTIIHCGKTLEDNVIVPTTSRSILTTVFDLFDDPNKVDHKFVVVDDICPTPNENNSQSEKDLVVSK